MVLLPRRTAVRWSYVQRSNLSSNSNVPPFYGSPRRPPGTDSLVESAAGIAAAATSTRRRILPLVSRPLGIVAPPMDRWARTLQGAATAARDPTRADAVAAVGELTGRVALRRMLQEMRYHPVGRQILSDRPLVTRATLPPHPNDESTTTTTAALQNSNLLTFGQAYRLFLMEHGFDPDDRDAVQYLPTSSSSTFVNHNYHTTKQFDDNHCNDDNDDIAYVMTRYRQCHDFWHALTGLPPTVLGELGLKWLELMQTGLPIAALSCTAGSVYTLLLSSSSSRYALSERLHQFHVVWNVYLPWARRQPMDPMALMNVYYEKEWDTPLVELRQRLKLEAAPLVVY